MSDTLWEAAWERAQQQPQQPEMEWEDYVEEDPEANKLSQDVLGLVYLGKLTDVIDVYGHQIEIRTLTIGEELDIGLLTQPFESTAERGRAYMTAVAAACIETVDGRPLPIQPLGPSSRAAMLREKFTYMADRYHWETIKKIYDGYMLLQSRVVESLEELEKKAQAREPSPSLDLQIDKDFSQEI